MKVLLCALFLSFASLAVPAADAPRQHTLVIGSIGNSPAEEIKVFHPFATYLARHLRDAGIERGKVVVTRSISEMADRMRAEAVDLYIDSPFPILAVSKLADSRLLLRRWKKGRAEYKSVFVVRADSPIRSLADLSGKVMAFESPFSTSGYLLPKAALLEANYAVREFADPAAAVGAREVGFVFSGEKEATLLWVMRGRVQAGAVGMHDLEQYEKIQPGAVRAVHVSASVPRQLVSHRQGLDPALVKRIRDVLLAMEHSEEGRKALATFEQTTRFDELSAEMLGSLASLLKADEAPKIPAERK